jgi:hypothetical protein
LRAENEIARASSRVHIGRDRPRHLAQRWITYRRRLAVGNLFLDPYPALIAALHQN